MKLKQNLAHRAVTILLGASLLICPPARAQTAAKSMPAPNASAALTHQRHIPLQGQSNFRDLGGYQTSTGREVKWGMIYRSGQLANLDAPDYATIARLHIHTVYDLRTAAERQAAPTQWQAGPVQMLVSPKTGAVLGGGSHVHLANLSPAAARGLMIALYRKMPDQYAPEFSAIFQQLLAGHTPLLIHCEAGKDRSGLAAALILTALGVPRAQVMRDYELSNRYVTVTELEQNPADRALLTHLPPATASVLAGVDPAYLNAAFQSIDQQYGSVDAYLDKALAVGPAQQAQLRSMLLE